VENCGVLLDSSLVYRRLVVGMAHHGHRWRRLEMAAEVFHCSLRGDEP